MNKSLKRRKDDEGSAELPAEAPAVHEPPSEETIPVIETPEPEMVPAIIPPFPYRKLTWSLFGVSAILALFIFISNIPPPAHKYDAFAKCIANSGATFYGAFWCPHCRDQKNMFGTGAQYLPYVECSTPDGASEFQSCKDRGVKGYPTWVFKDGSRLTGTTPLNVLSQKTACPLPTSTRS